MLLSVVEDVHCERLSLLVATAVDDEHVAEDTRYGGRVGARVGRSGGNAVRATNATAQLQCWLEIRSKLWLQSRGHCHFVGSKGSSMDGGTPSWILEKRERR